MTKWRERIAVALLFITTTGFIILRVFGFQHFDNNWSLTLWQYQPWWYNALWAILFFAALIFAFIKSAQIAGFFNSTLRKAAGLLFMILLLFLFQFDSILFAGGNLRIAQLAQSEHVIHRWYEFGSSLLAVSLFGLFKLFGVVANTAAMFAWNTLLWISVLCSLAGSLILTGELTRRFEIRFWLFLIIFFGPHTLSFLGLLGPQITFAPVLTWFSLFAFRALKNRSLTALATGWLIVLVGIFFHCFAVFLLPAAIYVTLHSTLKLKRWSFLTFLAASLSFGLVLGIVCYLAKTNLEFSRDILFLDGKHPFVSYGLFSVKHISDAIQILLLAFPQILAVLFLLMTERRQGAGFNLNGFSWLLFLSGLTVLFIIDPVHSILLDLPLFVVYLAGAGILAAAAVRLALDRAESSPRLPAMMAIMAIFLPLSFAPIYSRISVTDAAIAAYLEDYQDFYIPVALAMRDAYFFDKNFDKANQWEQILPVKSQDYLGFRGADDLAQRGQFDGAIEELYRLKTKFPYWTEPRQLLTQVQLYLGQLERAKAEIDTLLMLEPYKKSFHQNRINYYFQSRNYDQALAASDEALKTFSEDSDFLVDKMTALFNTGKIVETDSLARDLIRLDSNLGYPYMFKGLILDRSGNKLLAIRDYERFLKLSPDAPDAPEIRKRLNTLVLESKPDSN